MNATVQSTVAPVRELTLTDQLLAWAAWILSGGLFFFVGWFAMAPENPFASVSLLTATSGLAMWVQAAALAAVVAALATVMTGRKHSHAGVFAVGIGLAAVSLRGANAEFMLLRSIEVDGNGERGLALRYALESLAWFLVILWAFVVSTVVARWCFGAARADRAFDTESTLRPVPVLLSSADQEQAGSGYSSFDRADVIEGLKHAGIAFVAGCIALRVFSTGSHSRAIEHGQACFVVAGTMWLAGYITHRVAPTRSAFWPVVAVGALAMVNYLIASLGGSTDMNLPANIPASPVMRILPIQWIGVGAAAAVLMTWYMVHPFTPGGDWAPDGSGESAAERA